MPKRNILLIIADDLGKGLSCKTPSLDALAASGVTFDNAFASTASCSGSRSTIYTGLHTHQNGQYGLQHTFHHFQTFDNVETLPKLFNDAGYLTGIVGKIHVGPSKVYPWTVNDESGTRDIKWITDRAEAFFDKAIDANQPFHLTIGYMDPHRDSTRGGFANDQKYPGVEAVAYKPESITVPHYLNDLPAVREELVSYFRAISRMDQGVGMILKQLRKKGLEEDTLVVFASDNGPPFLNSKTTLYDDGVRLPLIIRQPGGPRGITNTAFVSWIDLLPTFLDFAGVKSPTNPAAPARLGRSFLPVLEQTSLPPDEWQEVFGSHTFHELTNYYPTRFIRTRRWKYHRNVCWQIDFPFSADIYASKSWEAIRKQNDEGRDLIIGKRKLTSYIRRGPEELYDMDSDPYEVVNLAQDPQYQQVLLELRTKVEAWQRKTEDPWLFRDGVSLKSMGQYIGEDDWALPDRFDFQAGI